MVLTPEKMQSMIADWMGKKAAIPTEQVGDYTVLPANAEALREAGLTDEQIAQLDLRNGGNVDEEGNVLFLDADRLARKEHPNQPMYENAPDMADGVPAMWDFIAQNLMEAKPANWEMVKQGSTPSPRFPPPQMTGRASRPPRSSSSEWAWAVPPTASCCR